MFFLVILLAGCFSISFHARGTNVISFSAGELPLNSFPPNQAESAETENGGRESMLKAAARGAWVEYYMEIPEAKTYQVTVSACCGADKGIYRLIADGYAVGQPFNLYASKTTNEDISIGDVTFLRSGTHVFRFVVAGKNHASAGYSFTL